MVFFPVLLLTSSLALTDETGPLPVHMIGKYVFQESTGFDEFLAALGLDSEKRTIACTLKPTQTIGQVDGQVTIKTESKVKNTDIKFKLGEPFQEETVDGRSVTTTAKLEETADGRTVTTTAKLDGDTLTKTQVGALTVTEIRHFQKDGDTCIMHLTLTIEGKPEIKSLRTHKRE